jgi:DNA-binding CsgD family transcriptional regulator/PAS domain-containing protein
MSLPSPRIWPKIRVYLGRRFSPEVPSPKQNAISSLLEVLYGAVLDPARWDEFTKTLAVATGSTQVAIFYAEADAAVSTSAIRSAYGFSDQEKAVYTQHFFATDVWLQKFRQNPRVGAVVSQDLYPPEELVKTEFYNDYLRVFEKFHQCGCTLGGDNYLTLIRPRGAAKYQPRELAIVNTVYSHLINAAKLQGERSLLRAVIEANNRLTGETHVAALLVDSRGRVIYSNPAATAMLNKEPALRICGEGLQARHSAANAALQVLINEAVKIGTAAGGTVAVPRAGKLPLCLRVIPLPAILGILPGGAALVVVTDPAIPLQTPAAVLEHMFSLTGAEGRLAKLLAQGLSLSEAVEILGVSRNTVKAQAKAIYSKTGVRSQAQLVVLAARLALA